MLSECFQKSYLYGPTNSTFGLWFRWTLGPLNSWPLKPWILKSFNRRLCHVKLMLNTVSLQRKAIRFTSCWNGFVLERWAYMLNCSLLWRCEPLRSRKGQTKCVSTLVSTNSTTEDLNASQRKHPKTSASKQWCVSHVTHIDKYKH